MKNTTIPQPKPQVSVKDLEPKKPPTGADAKTDYSHIDLYRNIWIG